jgi:2-methylcitrate dehydratase PrpD
MSGGGAGMSEDALRTMARAASRLRPQTLPPAVLKTARQRVLDTLGCLVAGYDAEMSAPIRAHVLAQGGKPEATLLPGGEKTTAALAGLAHATYIFGLELSDAAPRGTVHPGCEIVSIALAVAEREGLPGAAILPALVAGYETEIRFGRALHPQAFYKGWSTIGLLGAIGPAVTAAHLMGADETRMFHTIGTVMSLLPAATGRVSQGGSVKWLVGGHACATGLFAADMAARGAQGNPDALDIWLPVIAETHHRERLTEGIGGNGDYTQWEITSGVVTKYYGTVGPLAAPLEALFRLIAQHHIRGEDVQSVHVDCPRRTALFNKPHPRTDPTARASLPYCMAVALHTGNARELLGPAYRPQRLHDAQIAALADRVHITENEDYERQYPARSLARVTVRLHSGAQHSLETDRSEIKRYLTPGDADIEEKFRLIATPVLGEAKTDTVVALAWRLETLPDLGALLAALKP